LIAFCRDVGLDGGVYPSHPSPDGQDFAWSHSPGIHHQTVRSFPPITTILADSMIQLIA
jgi:hypothetical protein